MGLEGSTLTTASVETRHSGAGNLHVPLQSIPISIERLAEALDTVHRLCPELPVRAIRWMYVKYPLHQIQEEVLREQSEGRLDLRGQLDAGARDTAMNRVGLCVLYALVLCGRLLWLRVILGRELAALRRERFDVVGRTCCFGTRRPAGDRDFYYGDLQHRLTGRSVRMLLLCTDVTGGSWTRFAKAYCTRSPIARLPELALVPILAPLRLLWQQLKTWIRLRRLAAQTHDPLVRRISLLASRDCLVPNTTLAALAFWVGRAAVRTWRPRALLMLHEGHAWEYCLRGGAKTADASCRVVGYQHTTVFRESLSLTRPSQTVFGAAPADVVLCLGQIPLERLRAGHQPYRTRLIRFGSFRAQTIRVEQPADPSRRTILVTPEGIHAEVTALFAFAYACAQRLPSYTFVLRCHPEVPIASAVRLVSMDLTQQPNIVLSEQRSIEEDFARSSAVLYRGSSSVFYGILHGLVPIYLSVAAMRDRDPLDGLDAWRVRCATPEECAALLLRQEQTAGERRGEWDAAVRYVTRYAEPVTEEHVDAFLESAGLAREWA